MKKFDITYSDGKTARLYDAQLSFLSHSLSIRYIDEHGFTHVINWDIDKINPTQFGASFQPKLTYGDFPFETIEVGAGFFEELQSFYPTLKLKNKTNRHIQKNTWRTILLAFVIIAGFSALSYFYIVPGIADKVAQSIPVKYEMQLGEQIYQQNMLPFTTDSAKTVLANKYFEQMVADAPYPVKVTVVDNTIVNAFAMPGGHIVIFTGLLNQMKHHEELAGVLAHEYGHIYYRHSLRSMARSLANYALLSLVIGDVSGLAGILIDNADYIMSMKYSREMERQADAFAFELMHKNGINPQGMVWLFETLNDLQKDEELQIQLPEFMSSHPETVKRIDAMTKMAKTNKTTLRSNEQMEVIWGQLKR